MDKDNYDLAVAFLKEKGWTNEGFKKIENHLVTVATMMEVFVKDQFLNKNDLKDKVRKSINIIQELPINETSKQGGISSLKLILNE